MQRLVLIFIFFLLVRADAMAVDPIYSQFYANPLYLNPAFAGSARCSRFVFNFRDQWPAMMGTYITYGTSYDVHVYPLQGGVGFIFMGDRSGQGTLSTINFSGIYAYEMEVSNEFTLKAGMQVSYFQKAINWDKLIFGDMIDSQYGYVYNTQESRPLPTKGYADFSTGILGYSKNYYGGIAVHHLTQPNEGFLAGSTSPLYRKYTLHGGAKVPLNYRNDIQLSPNVLFQYQGGEAQLNMGMYLNISSFTIGAWYRNKDAVIILAGIEQDNFKFGLSYDTTISRLGVGTGGSIELSYAYIFYCNPESKKRRSISCPSF